MYTGNDDLATLILALVCILFKPNVAIAIVYVTVYNMHFTMQLFMMFPVDECP